jgi:hypothetical protein
MNETQKTGMNACILYREKDSTTTVVEKFNPYLLMGGQSEAGLTVYNIVT